MVAVDLTPSPGLAQSTGCNFPSAGHPNSIRMTVTQNVRLGTVARPDMGSASSVLILSPDGTRTLPPNLTLRLDETNPARMPLSAIVDVTGKAGCQFRVTVDSTTADLFNVRFQSTNSGNPLSTSSSGATGTLVGGTFQFRLGVSRNVDSTTNSLAGSITITVSYI